MKVRPWFKNGRMTAMAGGFVCLLLMGVGCASQQPRTTRLTLDDYHLAVGETVAQLEASPFFAGRSASSPKVVVTIDKVENLTTDLIPESEQWMLVLSVWNDPQVQQLIRLKNVVTQVRPERLAWLRQRYPDAASGWSVPTHVLAAQFRTATRVTAHKGKDVAGERVEQYQMEYSLTRIDTGATEWNGLVEFKRHASGTLIN